MTKLVKPVQTQQDIEKKIEIEMANLMYFQYMDKDSALKEAKAYVNEKYKDVIAKLSTKKQ